MESDKKPNILRRFLTLMENDPGTAKFSKFKKPSDLPSRFLRARVPLQGTVMRIDPSCGTLLMVDHKPLLPFFRMNRQIYLPIKLAGVDVTANGISWLQVVLTGKQITFVPVARKQEYVDCLVTVPQNEEHLKVGEELVKLGFAKVAVEAELKSVKDKDILAYRKSLVKAQKWAEHRRNGYWHFAKRPTLLWEAYMVINNKLKSLLPTSVTRFFNI